MVKRRTFHRRHRRARSRGGSPRIPLEVAMGLISLPFQTTSNFASPYDYVKAGDTTSALRSVIFGFTGVDTGGVVKPTISQLVNPLDFSAAGMLKVLLITGLVSRIRKRVVHIPMKKIPFIGGIVS